MSNLTSQHSIGDICDFQPNINKIAYDRESQRHVTDLSTTDCTITGISFTASKVHYDIGVHYEENGETHLIPICGVDSLMVLKKA